MSKMYVNGFGAPMLRIKQSDGSFLEYTISRRYQFLKEYYEKIGLMDTLIDGAKRKKPLYVNYEWELSLVDSSTNPDLLFLKQVEDADSKGIEIRLRPHYEVPWREFRVFVKDELRELGIEYHYNGKFDDLSNTGFKMSFVNADRIPYVDMFDPNNLPLVAAESCFEF